MNKREAGKLHEDLSWKFQKDHPKPDCDITDK